MPAAKLPASEASGLSNRKFGLGLALLAVVYIVAAAWQYSPALFGAYHDDTLYFSAAKALAEGEGAVWPNLPESDWVEGAFSSPHDLHVDQAGNIYVAEWLSSGVGKCTKLVRQ